MIRCPMCCVEYTGGGLCGECYESTFCSWEFYRKIARVIVIGGLYGVLIGGTLIGAVFTLIYMFRGWP